MQGTTSVLVAWDVMFGAIVIHNRDKAITNSLSLYRVQPVRRAAADAEFRFPFIKPCLDYLTILLIDPILVLLLVPEAGPDCGTLSYITTHAFLARLRYCSGSIVGILRQVFV